MKKIYIKMVDSIVTSEDIKVHKVESSNNSDLKNIKKEIDYLEKMQEESFDYLRENKFNRKIAIDCLKEFVPLVIGGEVVSSIVCYDGLNALITMSTILVTSAVFSSIPIKLLKESNENIDELETIIPKIQEKTIIEQDKYNKLKYEKDKKKTKIKVRIK